MQRETHVFFLFNAKLKKPLRRNIYNIDRTFFQCQLKFWWFLGDKSKFSTSKYVTTSVRMTFWFELICRRNKSSETFV